MIYILHLETATKACSVALSLNGELKQLKEITEDGFSHGENLTLFIEEVLKIEQISVKELKAVSLSSGPGSYTGLRIGVSVAKGLCYSLNIPLIAIDSLECIYEIAKLVYPKKTIIPMIDARRMEVFSSIYSSKGELLKPISADVIDEQTYSEFDSFIACGDGAEKLKEIWEKRNIIFDSTILSSAKGQVDLAFKKFQANDFVDVAYFEPFYLKDFVTKQKTPKL
ncbi:MAG: tRNA (adenosine(37)-N6)-threonylcarbamoyltransferase complex dimerization subunit type 1 TsaB [Bacteroidota bacterium]